MQQKRDYRILPGATDEGGGYCLKLLLDDVEVDSRIFGADPEASSRDGTEWFNSLNEAGRALWLYEAHSTQPRDAWATYRLRRAYRLAQEAGQEWKTG